LPAKEEIESVLPVVGYQNILLDPLEKTVRFAKPGVEIDPGGIGKGYAVDKMVEKLKEYGIRSALISAGGSSIYGLGAPPNDSGWTVRIRHPRKWSETLEELKLTNQSLSTSGDYEKFFEAGGRIYSHLMDPRTGYPAVGAASVSVLAPTTLASEAWTKPFFINGKAWAEKNKPKDLRVFICEDKAEVTCAWLP
jgi:thiamine biosynthesis lipoprotein